MSAMAAPFLRPEQKRDGTERVEGALALLSPPFSNISLGFNWIVV